MAKLEAEMDRQGIQMTPNELARESAVAHNQSLNYGGATPSMAVYGTLPRPLFQEDSTEIASVADTADGSFYGSTSSGGGPHGQS